MTRFGLLIAISLAVISLAWGYGLVGLQVVSRWMVGFGLFWLIAAWNRWVWVSGLGLFLSLAFATLGLWYGFSVGWMLAGALGGVLAWDLTQFGQRLRFALRTEDLRGLERLHLTRVLIVAMIGLGVASLVTIVRKEYTPEWGILLGLVALLGFVHLVMWYRR